MLRLTVGQGGYKAGEHVGFTGAAGGGGYGPGGDTSYSPVNGPGANTMVAAGSGGGGSVILSGTTPLIVAPGGGGQGQSTHSKPANQPAFGYTATGTAFNTLEQGNLGRKVWVSNGGVASADTPGSGGDLSGATASGGSPWARESLGQNGAARPGGSGGDGVYEWNSYTRTNGTVLRNHVVSAGGGGGYAGGGSGGVSRARWDAAPNTLVSAGGDGGRGSNYISASRVSNNTADTLSGQGAADRRTPGRIVLTYTVCP
ncbi:hypothetical protein GCM10023159_29830 [Brevibacterium yomogidense]